MRKITMKCHRRRPKRRSSSSDEDEEEDDRITIRKGPWKAEEDEVVLKHVHKYGPRDWSSLLSKGLLPRSGKSCRLRWVNKLRPNLKSGCKFSAEEERIVIELQSQIGNKWAKIATYLPGRTDNDVKNFWSSRQKRLARLLLHSQPQNLESKPNTAITNFVSCSSSEVANHGSLIGESSSSSKSHCRSSSYYTSEAHEIVVPCSALVDPTSNCLGFPPSQNLIPYDQQKATESSELEPHKVSFQDPQPESQLLSPQAQEELVRTLDLDFMGEFPGGEDYLTWASLDHYGNDQGLMPLSIEMPSNEQSGGEIEGRGLSTFLGQEPVTPDRLFDDLPVDILDQIDSLPSPPSGW